MEVDYAKNVLQHVDGEYPPPITPFLLSTTLCCFDWKSRTFEGNIVSPLSLECNSCGIVLCSRDAKFAVDCDTCRLSYCLVCLASGSKDPCVRCGHRPSKRMEQLVHLRLKSIYKAFKQSSKSPKNQMDPYFNQDYPNESGPTIEELKEGMEDIQPTRKTKEDHAPAMAESSSPPDMLAEQFLEEKQKEADAAAEALLAELEEEEEAAKTKKSKKKKKKERLQKAKKKEDNEDESIPIKEDSKPHVISVKEETKQSPERVTAQAITKLDSISRHDSTTIQARMIASPTANSDKVPETAIESHPIPHPQFDPFEKRLYDCVEECNIDGIEGILFELKGIPGRAALRKNAKKALKRLRAPATAATEEEEEAMKEETGTESNIPNQPVELLRLVSDHNITGKQPNRAECIMQMSPIVIGWVIGKGGQRIRDLMEESGAKVWIDQEKAKADEARNVYISGERKAVDQAVHMVREIVSKAPIEGAAKYAPDQDKEFENTFSPVENPQEAVARSASHSGGKTLSHIISGPTESLWHKSTPLKPTPVTSTSGPIPATTQSFEFHTSNDEDKFEHVMTCEARFVPLLIGKRGWAIKDIQDKSGARVDIDQTVTPRQIRISGCKTSVDKAIPMVRDVLSYPHAQPQPGTDMAHGIDQILSETAALQLHAASTSVTETGDRPDTPPPYTYITTGDAKSAISASSSLSSTPEPSMVSSSVKGMVPRLAAGTRIPPHEYSMPTISRMHAPSTSRGQYVPQDFPIGLNHASEPGAFAPQQSVFPPVFGGGLIGLQLLPGVGLPPPHLNHEPVYNHAPTTGPIPFSSTMMRRQPPLAVYGNSSMASPNSTKMIHGNQGNQTGHVLGMAPPPSHRNSDIGAMGISQPQHMGAYASMPIGAGFDARGGHPLSGWDSVPMGRDYAPPPGIPSEGRGPLPSENFAMGTTPVSAFMNSFQPPAPSDGAMTRGRNVASMALGDGFDTRPAMGDIGRSSSPFNTAIEPSGQPLPMSSIRDDSRIIDSLFGPTSNSASSKATSTASPPVNLLTGLDGLHLGSAGATSCVSSGGTGLWGGPLPEWTPGTGAASNLLDSTSNDSALESSILAGLQPFPLNDDPQHHPSQSRFNWGSTNA